MTHVCKAGDTARKQEHREMGKAGEETLTGTKYLWLYSKENLPEKHQDRFDALKAMNLRTDRARAIKESFRELWEFASRGGAHRHFKKRYFWATHSRLKPITEVARIVHKHIDNILTYYAHPITNAICEGLNSKIQTIQQKACGFRNREHLKTAIYFHCGGLNLYPFTHWKPG